LAAAVIRSLTGGGLYQLTVSNVAASIASGAPVPGSFEELGAMVGEVEGVHLAEVVAALGADGEAALARVLDDARALPPEQLYAAQLARFEATLALLVAAAQGNSHAASALGGRLERAGLAGPDDLDLQVPQLAG
jgi:hypothetical protein